MLEIQERFSNDGYENIVKAAGNNRLHITEALDRGEVNGFIAYSYEENQTVIYDYDDGGDLYLCDGLVRSVLFKSCLKGIDTAVFKLSEKEKYESLEKLKFVKSDNYTLQNLDEFMNNCKKCRKDL